MSRQISRATINSLKATQTAHRMANEILNPQIELPAPKPPEPIRVATLAENEGLLPSSDEARILEQVQCTSPRKRPRRAKYEVSHYQENLIVIWIVVLSIVIVLLSINYVMNHL